MDKVQKPAILSVIHHRQNRSKPRGLQLDVYFFSFVNKSIVINSAEAQQARNFLRGFLNGVVICK
jgi:hypothetical protein